MRPLPGRAGVVRLREIALTGALLSLAGASLAATTPVTPCTTAAFEAALGRSDDITFVCSGTIVVPSTVFVLAGKSLSIDGSGQTVVLEASDGTSKLRLFYVQPGGSLTLKDLTLADSASIGAAGISGSPGKNGTRGADGASSASPNVAPNDGEDGTDGERGGPGGRGEDGKGGAVYDGGTLTVASCRFVNDNAVGGNGGFGGAAGWGGSGGFGGNSANYSSQGAGTPGGNGGKGGRGGEGGQGGSGGDGLGGAIYIAATGKATISSSTFDHDLALGGNGGGGGGGLSGGEGGLGGLGGLGLTAGGNGGDGGDAGEAGGGGDGGKAGSGKGGAIDNDGGALSVTGTTFSGNGADGGAGGTGGIGGETTNGGDGGMGGASTGPCNGQPQGNGGNGGANSDSGDGGANGDGGDAFGGAIYASVPITQSDLVLTENAVLAGAAQGPDCVNAPFLDCPGEPGIVVPPRSHGGTGAPGCNGPSGADGTTPPPGESGDFGTSGAPGMQGEPDVDIDIVGPLEVTTGVLASATVGEDYRSAVESKGGVPPDVWNLAAGSSMPPGLFLGADGSVTGVPFDAGSFTFTVTVRDAASHQASGMVGIVVLAPASRPGIKTPNEPKPGKVKRRPH